LNLIKNLDFHGYVFYQECAATFQSFPQICEYGSFTAKKLQISWAFP
jgi:hypothetical protein